MTLPALDSRRVAERAGRIPFRWMARELSLTALSGQTVALTRTATATPTDSFGAAQTVVHSEPAWQYDSGKAKVGLLLGTNAQVGAALPLIPQAMGGAVHFIENGGKAVVGGGLWYLGNDGATGARIWIEADGTVYLLKYTDGTTTRTVTLGAAPSSGDEVWIRWALSAAGVAQLWQSINGAAETTPGAAAALTLPAAWAGTTMRLNSVGTANQGNNLYLDAAVMLGVPTLAQLQAVLR